MRVLISAIACHPNWGSESYFGWAAVNALAVKHDLTVLTSVAGVKDCEAAAAHNHRLRNVRFIGVGQSFKWHPNRLLARLQSWGQYASWCREAHKVARKLAVSGNYDIAHHVTYSTWRQASPLSGVGIPWILGPIGGGETFPAGFRGTLSMSSLMFEFVRDAQSQIAMRSPALRRSLQSASLILASTTETRKLLSTMGVSSERIKMAPAAFIHSERVDLFREDRKTDQATHLRIFAGGNLEGRKGLALALRALADLQEREVPFEFTFAGHGPELSHVKELATRLSLDPAHMHFRNSLPLDQYRQALRNSDVYLLPSLRESGGLTLGEAMLTGCVPVVVKAGGPGLLVTPDCGYAFEPESPEHVIKQMTNALSQIWKSPERRERLSKNAAARAAQVLSEERYLSAIETAYVASTRS